MAGMSDRSDNAAALRGSRRALLVALAIDNFGSGLFLPLALIYVTRVVGLPLGVAGSTVALGTAIGLLVPPLAGRLVDRIGPRPVVIAAQLLQAAGALGYLFARGLPLTVVAALLPTLDPVTMILEMVPLYILFELSIVLARLFGRPSEEVAERIASAEGT